MTLAALGSIALAYAGLELLCLGTERGARAVLPGRALARGYLRAAGWTLLALSILPSLHHPAPAIGLVAWTGLLTAAALPLTLGLPYAPRAVALAGPCLLAMVATTATLLSGF